MSLLGGAHHGTLQCPRSRVRVIRWVSRAGSPASSSAMRSRICVGRVTFDSGCVEATASPLHRPPLFRAHGSAPREHGEAIFSDVRDALDGDRVGPFHRRAKTPACCGDRSDAVHAPGLEPADALGIRRCGAFEPQVTMLLTWPMASISPRRRGSRGGLGTAASKSESFMAEHDCTARPVSWPGKDEYCSRVRRHSNTDTKGAAALLACALSLVATGATCAVDSLPAPRPGMEEIAVPSGNALVNGLILHATIAGLHGVAVILHGYPGNEHSADLARAVQRAGFDALFVDYRGSWESAGTFSFTHALDDTAAVLDWVRTPENAAKYGFDGTRVAVVGHSFGGWLALMTANREPPSVCVVALAAWNVGWAAQRFAAHDDERVASLDDFRATTDAGGGPIHANADDLQREITENAEDWNYLRQAKTLGVRPLLLVAATRDSPDEDIEMHENLARAIREASGQRVHIATFEDDHPFSAHRLALDDLLTAWLRADCASRKELK